MASPTGRWRHVLETVSWFGQSEWIVYPASAAALVLWALASRSKVAHRRDAYRQGALVSLFVLLAVAIPGLIAAALKAPLCRPRPLATRAVETATSCLDWTQQSLPSGHAATAVAAAFVVGFLLPRLFWPAIIGAAAICSARIGLKMHYPSDVVAGAILGAAGAFGVRKAFALRGWVFAFDEAGAIRRGRAVLPQLRPQRTDRAQQPDRP